MDGFRLAHHAGCVERRLVPEPVPFGVPNRGRPGRKSGAGPVADKKQVAQGLHPIPLSPMPEQRGHRHAHPLAQEIEDRSFKTCRGMVHGPVVERLAPPSLIVHGPKGGEESANNLPIGAQSSPDHEFATILKRAEDPRAARRLASAAVSRGIRQDPRLRIKKGAWAPLRLSSMQS